MRGTPSETQYRPNVVLPGLGGKRDIVRRDLWFSVTCCAPFQEHCATFPTPCVSEKGGYLHIELRYGASQISRGLLDSTLSGRHMRGRRWAFVSVAVDHAARLLSCTRGSVSVSTHSSCEVGTWFGSSMGVTSAPFNWEPSKIPADTD